MKASDFIARYLERQGVTQVFELVGGMITHLLDSLSRTTSIRIVSCHHEQGAGFAAEGAARISGVPGIALATSGPGATNLLTAIGSCHFDSTPAVFITGQVNTHELRGASGVRQLGFQETDIVAMAAPITKSAVQVRSAAELPEQLARAFELALSGRQGPCLLDVPMNVQSESIDEAIARRFLATPPSAPDRQPAVPAADLPEPLRAQIVSLLQALPHGDRPLLLMGGGCATLRNRDAARGLARLLGIPVVLSLMGVDLLPHDDPDRVGFIGSYGNRWANKALGEADLLVVAGSRLDIRQTGADVESFCAGKRIWQIDIDAAEMGLRVKPIQAIHADLPAVVEALGRLRKASAELPPPGSPQRHLPWRRHIEQLRRSFPPASEYGCEPGEVNPIQVLQRLSDRLPAGCVTVTDVGQHQMWAAQSLRFRSGDRFLTSGGMGAMGFGLPAAIGAAMAAAPLPTLLISGDGSFQLNIQELETLVRNRLAVKIILFNNQCHGMVRQFQESYFNGNLQSTATGYSAPDFVAVAAAYGLAAFRLEEAGALEDALERLLAAPGPALLDVPLSPGSKVYPKLAFGRRFGEMEPEASPIAMEST